MTATSGRTSGTYPLIDLNPLDWLGDAAKEGAANAFTAMMMSLWSAGLWLLRTVFDVIDKFTTPDLTDPGLHDLYAITLWVSLVVALIIGLGQLGLAAIRRDGRHLGSLLIGLAQYGATVTGWFTVCGAMVLGCAGLTTGLLNALLDVQDFSGFAAGSGWVDQVSGTVEAAVLGICALFMLIPAAFGYLIIMLVREAALLILTATLPIAAAGALGDGTRTWMWKAIRWFLAASLTAPLLALTLGLGVQIARAAFPEADTRHPGVDRYAAQYATQSAARSAAGAAAQAADAASAAGIPDTAANIGMAVVGCVIMLVACFCPMALFRLLAFVDPGTSSGATFRSTLAANGGVSGLLTRRTHREPAPSTAATQASADGRTASETSADAETANRFQSRAARVLPAAGKVIGGTMNRIGSVAQHGAAAGADVMAQAGLGHPTYHQVGADTPSRNSHSSRSGHPAGASPIATPSSAATPSGAADAAPSIPSAEPHENTAGSGHPPVTRPGPGASPAELQTAAEEGAFLA